MLVALREQRVLKLFSLSPLSLSIFFGCFVFFLFLLIFVTYIKGYLKE